MSPDLRKLRPSKVRNALRRRWFEHQLSHIQIVERAGLIDIGTRYGGWMIPQELIEASWTCYCAGLGGDPSFDLELIKRYGANVRAFDPVLEFVELANQKAANEPRFTAYQAAICNVDGPVRMQVTHDPKSKSVSSAGLYESEEYVELPGRTLTSFMRELGDTSIDLLKLDIEGGEYEIVPNLDLRSMGVQVFAVQLHHIGGVRAARRLIAALREQGYEPVACRRTLKITFLRSDANSEQRTAVQQDS